MNTSFEKEASCLYPVPFTFSEPDDWDFEKSKHIKHWSDRFGLTDARPFKMKPGKIRIRVSWKKENSMLNITAKFSDDMTSYSKIKYKDTAIFDYLKKLYKTYGLRHPDLSNINSEKGEICLFSPDIPEHDWLVWTRDLYKDTRFKLRRKSVNLSISRYKRDSNFLSDLNSLKKYIYSNCQSEDQNSG